MFFWFLLHLCGICHKKYSHRSILEIIVLVQSRETSTKSSKLDEEWKGFGSGVVKSSFFLISGGVSVLTGGGLLGVSKFFWVETPARSIVRVRIFSRMGRKCGSNRFQCGSTWDQPLFAVGSTTVQS